MGGRVSLSLVLFLGVSLHLMEERPRRWSFLKWSFFGLLLSLVLFLGVSLHLVELHLMEERPPLVGWSFLGFPSIKEESPVPRGVGWGTE